MISTWYFSYDTPEDDFSGVEFCAETLDEAFSLFWDYLKENHITRDSLEYLAVETVYEEDDAKEYGDRYDGEREFTMVIISYT